MRTVSTNNLSSTSVHDGVEDCASIAGIFEHSGISTVGVRKPFLGRDILIDCASASKSDACKPGGSSSGMMRRLFGVEYGFLGDEDRELPIGEMSSSNSFLLLLLCPRAGIGTTVGGLGSPNVLLIGCAFNVCSTEGDGEEKRSPSIVCNARQLAINPTIGDEALCCPS